MTNPRPLKVAIIGGGIGGLVLANSLQHAGVDYILFERRTRIDSQEGASVGILPNGARILDQIGCYDELQDLSVSMTSTATHRHDGSLIGSVSDSLELMKQRTGYAVFFLDRKILLRVLSDQIVERDRIVLDASVQRIDQDEEKATVYCADGTTVQADVVVGADGTYSSVRQEMWRQANSCGHGWKFADDRDSMSAEYKCLFGISNNIPGMRPGQTDRTYARNISTLSYVGKEGRIFWFVFVKMDKVYYAPHIPRFTKNDATELVRIVGSLAIREGGAVTVEHLYNAKVACRLVGIEEANYQVWSYGRLVCLGDAIHKMTPNLGAGASSAMESAAVLSNTLVLLSSQHRRPSLSNISNAFCKYYEARALRVGRASRFSNQLTRMQALADWKAVFYTHYVAPNMDDFAAENFSSFVIGAPLIDHLPVPVRSLLGTMPFNPSQGWGFEESARQRALIASPLLGLTVLVLQHSPKHLHPCLAPQRWGGLVFADAFTGILLFEAARLNNQGSLIQLWIGFALVSGWIGADVVAPAYLFLLYILSPVSKFRASDSRLTDSSYTRLTGPVLLGFGVFPRWLACWQSDPSLTAVGSWMVERQAYLVFAAQTILVWTVLPSTVRRDRLWDTRRDMPWIRRSVAVLIAIAVTVPVTRLLYMLDHRRELSFSDFLEVAFPRAEFLSSAGVFFWLFLVYVDLHVAGMVESRLPALCVILLTCFGPGLLLSVGWLWREEILLTARHKDAITHNRRVTAGAGRLEKMPLME